MYDPFFTPSLGALGFGTAWFTFFLVIILVWSVAWRALALWHAARNKQRIWFLVILLLPVNTMGILEIVYLSWFRKEHPHASTALFPFLTKFEKMLADEISSRGGKKE